MIKDSKPLRSFIKFINASKFIKNDFKLNDVFYGDTEGRTVITIPPIFSLITHPDEAIEVYNKIFNCGVDKKSKGMFFDHTKCEDIEIAASAVMDVFVLNVEKYQMKIFKNDLPIGGILPKDDYLTEKLYVSGLLKHLKIDKATTELICQINENLKPLNLLKGGLNSTTITVTKSYNSGNASTKVINHFDKCLRTQGYELSLTGKNNFSHLIGEVINNCEIHSGDFCQWFALGHYDIQGDNEYGEFNLVLFNFGNTIYESLRTSQLSPKILASLKRLTNIHTGWFKDDWDEEVLWTLYALQDGVSRLKSDKKKDRGVGTVKLIKHFKKIGSTIDGKSPMMSIISGNSYILFNNDYPLEGKDVNGTIVQRIAFNESNNLEEPPDSNNVKKLKNYFPGTIVSSRFYLDKKFIDGLIDEEEISDE